MSNRVSRAPSAGLPVSSLRGQWLLVASMLAAIGVVTWLAWWDEQREAGAAMRDLESEQSVLARSLAADLRVHLAMVERDAVAIAEHGAAGFQARYSPILVRAANAPAAAAVDPARILVTVPLPDLRAVDLGVSAGDLVDPGDATRDNQMLVLVSPPDETSLHTTDGRTLQSPPLRNAIDRRLATLRLSRPEAAQVGLPERTSVAGIAGVDASDQRRWSVVTVASAARERDREKRAVWRLVLGVLVASDLVFAFGGAALRRQRKQLELQRELAVAEAQRERNEELLRAERVAMMGTFALGIAHEVSTPLGVIVGRAEQLLGRAQGDERLGRNAQAILNQADRIQNIIRRFLDMARGRPPSMEQADPADIVRAAVRAVEHRFARARVTLATDIPATMPLVQCDRDLLEHAVVNLLLNACEACQPDGHVSISARADAGQVGFVVVDDGPGISAENAARAAEPFFTTKADGAGTGLGLAIATEIVKSHRGELVIGPNRADGADGKGTRALIEIPIAPAASAASTASAATGGTVS
jgi:signal transduction histidine kinase